MNTITVNSGQICFASSRVYVQEGIYDEFIALYKLKFAAKSELLGDPEKQDTTMGPVVDKGQFDRILDIIETARRESQGNLIMGGKAKDGKVGKYRIPHNWSPSKKLTTNAQGLLH